MGKFIAIYYSLLTAVVVLLCLVGMPILYALWIYLYPTFLLVVYIILIYRQHKWDEEDSVCRQILDMTTASDAIPDFEVKDEE